MALFGQDRPDPGAVKLGSVLGDIVTGGSGRRAQDAYVDQFRKNAQAADAMWKARTNRAQALAREGLTGDVVREVFNDGAGAHDGIAKMLASGYDARKLGEFQTPGYASMVAERDAALAAGDQRRANILTNTLGGKATPTVQVNAQGIAYDPNATLGDLEFRTTPLADANIQRQNTLGDVAVQRANTYDATQRQRAGAYALGQQASAAQRYSAANLNGVRAAGGGWAPKQTDGKAQAMIDQIDADLESNGDEPLATDEKLQIMADVKAGREVFLKRKSKNAFNNVMNALGGMSGAPKKPFSMLDYAGGSPVAAGVQPNTDNGVGAPTPLGTPAASARVPVKGAASQPYLDAANDALKQARAAVAAGADREAVKKRLIQNGYPRLAERL